jgi:hypothetical protein
MRKESYETEEHAPGSPPYTIRVEYESGRERVPNVSEWNETDDELEVVCTDIGLITYENGKVWEVF